MHGFDVSRHFGVKPNLKKIALACLILFLSCGLFFSPLFSQEITGSLKGTIVLKKDRAPLLNVTVTIESVNLRGIKSIYTDENGKYRFPSLPGGIYRVRAESPGLKTIIREKIIRVGENVTLDFLMEATDTKELFTEVGKPPMMDLEKTKSSTNINSDVLNALPLTRDYLSIIKLISGINTAYGDPSVHGESYLNNKYLIDGIDTTDPGTGTQGTAFNFDNIKEIEFGTAGYEAEYGQVMGAVINIVTKFGGNRFSGSINFNIMDPSLRGENVPELEKESFPVKTSSRDYSLTLGVPIKKDKIWFFGSFQYLRNIRERDDVDYIFKSNNYRWMGKITAQLNPNHKGVIIAWGNPFHQYGEMLDPYWHYDTNPHSWGGSKLNAAGTWQWTINEKAQLQTKIFRFSTSENLEPTQDDSIPLFYDILTQKRWGNYPFHSLTDRVRIQGESDFTYYLDNLGGSHEIKTGIEYSYTYERKQLWFVGQGWGSFNLYYGSPFIAVYNPGKEDVKARGKRFSFYVQDTWNLTNRIILKPGIRFDYSVGKNDILEEIHNYKTLAPRIGFVFNLTADGKTIVKGNYCKFHENPILYFPDLFHKGNIPSYNYLYNPWTMKYDILLTSLGGPSTYKFLNKLRSPYLNEFLIGVEKEVLPNFSVNLTGIYRKTRDIIEDVEINLLYQDPENPYFPTGSMDGSGQPIMALGNPDEAYREYKGLELSFNKKFANNWMLLGSYTLSEAKGTVPTSVTRFLDSPGDTVNRDGYLPVDRRHNIKVAANYIFPYGINIGFYYQIVSGFPYTKLLMNPFYLYYGIYEIPLGAKDPITGKVRRYPTLQSLDLRIEKIFRIRRGELGIYIDIFNVLNGNTPVAYDIFDNILSPVVLQRVSPRSARINLRYSF